VQLFLPHYLGAALGVDGLREPPWDSVVAVSVICLIAGFRLARRSHLHTGAIAIAGLDLATQLLLVILGLALLFSPDLLTQGTSLGGSPSWSDLAFALPLAMLSYRDRNRRQPRRGGPRAGANAAADPFSLQSGSW